MSMTLWENRTALDESERRPRACGRTPPSGRRQRGLGAVPRRAVEIGAARPRQLEKSWSVSEGPGVGLQLVPRRRGRARRPTSDVHRESDRCALALRGLVLPPSSDMIGVTPDEDRRAGAVLVAVRPSATRDPPDDRERPAAGTTTRPATERRAAGRQICGPESHRAELARRRTAAGAIRTGRSGVE